MFLRNDYPGWFFDKMYSRFLFNNHVTKNIEISYKNCVLINKANRLDCLPKYGIKTVFLFHI